MPPRATSNTAKSTRGFCSTIRADFGPLRVGPDHQPLVDHDAVGRGHADLAAHALEDVRDHPRRRRLPVGAGHRDDRDPARRPGGNSESTTGLGHVLRLAHRRVGVHPEPGRRVHLADGAAGLAHRLGDVGGDEVDAGHVQPDHPGGLLRDLDVVRVRLEGAVDRDAAGGHVPGERELHHGRPRAVRRHREPLLADQLDRGVVHLDPGQHLLVADAAARVGVGLVDQLGTVRTPSPTTCAGTRSARATIRPPMTRTR